MTYDYEIYGMDAKHESDNDVSASYVIEAMVSQGYPYSEFRNLMNNIEEYVDSDNDYLVFFPNKYIACKIIEHK